MALTALTRRYPCREPLQGRDYSIEVTFARPDWQGVDEIIQQHALSKLSAFTLNPRVDCATGEALVNWVHERLSESALGPDLLGVALQESRKNRFVSGRSVGHVL